MPPVDPVRGRGPLARPCPENHAGIRPDWTCLVKGAKRRCAVMTLDETSPVWRPCLARVSGTTLPGVTRGRIGNSIELEMLALRTWGPATLYRTPILQGRVAEGHVPQPSRRLRVCPSLAHMLQRYLGPHAPVMPACPPPAGRGYTGGVRGQTGGAKIGKTGLKGRLESSGVCFPVTFRSPPAK